MGSMNWRCLAALCIPLGALSLASEAQAMGCSYEGATVTIPKNISIESISYMQMQDAPVRVTLWSERLGPRNTDNTQEALAKGVWTPVALQDPASFTLDRSHSWKLGVAALGSDNGEFSKSFDCVDSELHASGDQPYGYYLMSFIPHASNPGQVALQVKVMMRKGPLPKPPPQKTAKADKPAKVAKTAATAPMTTTATTSATATPAKK